MAILLSPAVRVPKYPAPNIPKMPTPLYIGSGGIYDSNGDTRFPIGTGRLPVIDIRATQGPATIAGLLLRTSASTGGRISRALFLVPLV
jgi:hypothetical protein